jgi:hypothetical protein
MINEFGKDVDDYGLTWGFFIFNVSWGGVTLKSKWFVGHLLAYCTSSEWYMSVEHLVEWELAGESEVHPMSTTNPTWLDQESNPGSGGGKPAAKRLSYCTA